MWVCAPRFETSDLTAPPDRRNFGGSPGGRSACAAAPGDRPAPRWRAANAAFFGGSHSGTDSISFIRSSTGSSLSRAYRPAAAYDGSWRSGFGADTRRIGIHRETAAVEPDDINAKGGKLVRRVPKLSEPAFWQAAPGPP